jgi:proteasome lid subunit RPN8/RPN11
MVAQAVAELPNECCGLLAGVALPPDAGESAAPVPRQARAVCRYALVNAAHSPTEYLSEPRSIFQAMRDMRDRNLELLGVYHSHPTTEPVPSRTDLERNYSEEVVNFIISLKGEPVVRAWWLSAEGFREAEWECVEE